METNHLNILAVGRNAAIMEVVHRLLNAHANWTGTIAANLGEALYAISTAEYDIVLVCAGITEEEAALLKERLIALRPATILIRHFGGGSGLLENEILAALDLHKAPLSQAISPINYN